MADRYSTADTRAWDTGPSVETWKRNQFAGKTHEVERPTADDPQFKYARAGVLAAAQTDWDTADEARIKREKWIEDGRKERADKATEDQKRREDEATAKTAADRAAALDILKSRYLSKPGMTLADWNAEDHAELLRREAREDALAGRDPASTARAAFARQYREF